jgi:hypothetical protein
MNFVACKVLIVIWYNLRTISTHNTMIVCAEVDGCKLKVKLSVFSIKHHTLKAY